MGGPSVCVLLFLVSQQRNCLGLFIGQNLGRRGDGTECWEKEGQSQGEIMDPEM